MNIYTERLSMVLCHNMQGKDNIKMVHIIKIFKTILFNINNFAIATHNNRQTLYS